MTVALLGLLACTSSTPPSTPEPAPAPAPVEAPRPPPEDGIDHVVASSLNLRDGPSSSAKKIGKLPINAPVRVLERSGEFAKIRAANGTEGWVAGGFLAPDPLTLESARQQATDAPSERLSWLQRAAAIEPRDRDVLTDLAAAYRDTGDTGAADRIAKQLEWPHDVLLIAPSHRRKDLAVQWAFNDLGELTWANRLLKPGEIERLGIPTEGWWVLPDHGAALPATVDHVWAGGHNECAGTSVIEVVLKAELPPGTVAVAASRGEPPKIWTEPGPTPKISREKAQKLADTFVAEKAGKARAKQTGIAPSGDGWFGVGLWGSGEFMDDITKVDFTISATGELTASKPRTQADDFLPRGLRDVDGDGAIETVWSDGCMAIAGPVDEDTWKRFTDSWCCGC